MFQDNFFGVVAEDTPAMIHATEVKGNLIQLFSFF